jgi:hypothetical protein
MNTKKIVNISEYKLKKTVNLYLLKTKEINEKLEKFLEGKYEQPRDTERKTWTNW